MCATHARSEAIRFRASTEILGEAARTPPSVADSGGLERGIQTAKQACAQSAEAARQNARQKGVEGAGWGHARARFTKLGATARNYSQV